MVLPFNIVLAMYYLLYQIICSLYLDKYPNYFCFSRITIPDTFVDIRKIIPSNISFFSLKSSRGTIYTVFSQWQYKDEIH